MAMIENIRKRRGLLIFFIGIGMLGFLVPYDAVMSLFGKTPGSETIGEINGKVINQGSFQKDLLAVQQSNLYRGDDNISSAAWTDLVNETLYAEDLDAAGYVVGDEEYEDVILGISPSAMVKQAYYGGVVNDETRAKAQELFETQPALSARAQKSMIVKRYKLEKLESLLKKGMYANSLDAERDYLLKNDKASVSFVSVKYSDLSDSTVTVSDSEVMSFFNRNKNNAKYQQRPFREVRYLEYDVFASPQDSSLLLSELAEFKAKFISSKDDSLYVIDHSDDRIYRKETYAAGTTAGVTDS
ncbi:MAG: peptidyl-prolyl cis-trans isomerase D, partial [Flavobacteriales bacterium]